MVASFLARAVVAAGLAAGVLVGAASVPEAAASTGPVVAASVLPLPAGAPAGFLFAFTSMSCAGAGWCVAAGQYYDAAGSHGVIDTLANGAWTSQTAPVPPGAYTGSNSSANLIGVACGAPGSCVAYGAYSTGTGSTSGWDVLDLHKGKWTPRAVTPPNGTLPSVKPVVGVGCTAADTCVAVGNYISTDTWAPVLSWAMYYRTGAAGAPPSWGGAQKLAQPADHADSTSQAYHARTNALACTKGAHALCFAVGDYATATNNEALIEAITPSAGTANPSQGPLPSGISAVWSLDNIGCDAAGLCAAYGRYQTPPGSASTQAWFVEPVGGAAFAPQPVPTLTPGTPTTSGIGCGGGGCMLTGSYAETSSATQRPLLDLLSSAGWAATAPPASGTPSTPSCGSAKYCLAIAYNQSVLYLWAGNAWAKMTPVGPKGDPGTATLVGTACDAPDSCWALGTFNDATTFATVGIVEHVEARSAVPPAVSLKWAPGPFGLAGSAKAAWKGTAGSSAIARYVVQVRRAAWNGGFGSWVIPAGWGSLPAATTAVKVPLPIGYDTCVRVRAIDSAGQTSAWTPSRCTARPIDDRALAASAGWVRAKGAAYYLGTYTATTHLGATLVRTGAQFDQLALVATRCPGCGKVAVYSGGTLLGTVNLHSATTVRQAVFTLPKVSLRAATITLKVVTSGKTIQIDGLGVIRT